MKAEVIKKNNMYKVFNDITLKNEIVIFGSTFTAEFPFYEFHQKYLMSNAIYNRSIEGLTAEEADEILDDSVLKAGPAKIFYAFDNSGTDDAAALVAYRSILNKTKKALPQSEIYVLSADDKSFNESLEKICCYFDAVFIDIDYKKSYKSIFCRLAPFFRSGRITFAEAFQIV